MTQEVARIYSNKEELDKLTQNNQNLPSLNDNQINQAKLFSNARIAVLELLQDNISFLEIGVAAGDTSEFICSNKKINNVYLLDPYNRIDFYGLRNFSKARYTPSTQSKFVYNRVSSLVSGQVVMLEGLSENILPIQDLYLDYIFIDGNHSYESVKLDLKNSASMLKPNGMIGIDDYTSYMVESDQNSISEYGVIRAVNEFLRDNHDFFVVGYAMNPIAPTIFIQRFPMV